MRDVTAGHEDAAGTQGPGTQGLERVAATVGVVKSFLRRHLLQNGEPSHSVTPLMGEGSAGPLLDAVTALHLRANADGPEGCGDAGAAISGIYKTLGVLVSVLQKREKPLGLKFIGEVHE